MDTIRFSSITCEQIYQKSYRYNRVFAVRFNMFPAEIGTPRSTDKYGVNFNNVCMFHQAYSTQHSAKRKREIYEEKVSSFIFIIQLAQVEAAPII